MPEDTFLSHHSTKHFYHLWDRTLMKTLFYHITLGTISITCETALWWRHFSITLLYETFLSLVRPHFDEDTFLSHHSTKHFYHSWDRTLMKTLFYHITLRNISITHETALWWRHFSITSLYETFLSLMRPHFDEDTFLSHHSTKHFYHSWDRTLMKTLFYHIALRNISTTHETALWWRHFSITSLYETFLPLMRPHFDEDTFLSHHSTKHFYHSWDRTLMKTLFYHITLRNISTTHETALWWRHFSITSLYETFLPLMRPHFSCETLKKKI